MGKKLLVVIGWLWPFLVAIAGVIAISSGRSMRGDGEGAILLFASLLGFPAIVATIAGRLPTKWDVDSRYSLAIMLAVPIWMIELLLAAILLAVGAIAVGSGWIEE